MNGLELSVNRALLEAALFDDIMHIYHMNNLDNFCVNVRNKWNSLAVKMPRELIEQDL